MKKLLLIILLASSFAAKVSAQDEATFGHYLINPVLANPAYSGAADKYQIFGHSHSQWSGFPGQPRTYALSANAPLLDKIGVGGLLLSDKYGLLDHTRAQLSYAYRYEDAKRGIKSGIGFSTEFVKNRLDPSVTQDAFYDQGDRIVEANIQNVTYFDVTAGAYVRINDKLNFSVALPNLVRARFGAATDTLKQKVSRPFIASAGYKFKYDNMSFEPSIVARQIYQGPFQVDLNMVGRFLNDKLMLGMSLRPGASGNLALMGGIKQDFLQIYYSYNSSLADVKTYARQAHEVTVGIEINRIKKQEEQPVEKKKKKYKN